MKQIILAGKRALVTGGSRGVGKGIVESLAQAGADVVIHCRSRADLAEVVAKKAQQLGVTATVVCADLTRPDDVKHMFDAIRREAGPIDILVNNAGTSQAKDIFQISNDDWRSLIDTNLTSAFLCSQAVVESMRQRRWGRIIFISSVVARQGALYGHAHYAASKSGMIGMAKTIARTLSPYHVTVNTLGVGMIQTELLKETLDEQQTNTARSRIPVGRFAEPCEVGDLCAFLASDLASYITGAMIDINGGMVMDG